MNFTENIGLVAPPSRCRYLDIPLIVRIVRRRVLSGYIQELE